MSCSTTPHTSREQAFDPRLKWALVPEFFASGIRNTFSPGWSHQPGLTISLVPGAKNSGTRAHFGRGSKVCSLLVILGMPISKMVFKVSGFFYTL